MDPVLAEFYGTLTDQKDETELQKEAQLELLVKIAEENDINLDDLTEEQLEEIAAELENDPGEETTEEQPAEDLAKEAQAVEMVKEADYAGRIMAHSFLHELREIEKNAQSEQAVLSAAKGMAQELRGGLAPSARRSAKAAIEQILASKHGRRALGVAAGTAGVAGAGGAAYGTYRGGKAAVKKIKEKLQERKEKKSEDVVAARAYEFLAEAGLVDQQGNVVPPEALQKQATDVELDTAALKMLEGMGYPVEWNK